MTQFAYLSFSPYSGSHYSPENPRSIGPAAAKNFDKFFAKIPTFTGEGVLVRRAAGMFQEDVGTSWELQDYRWLTKEWGIRYGDLAYACRNHGKRLAFNVGLKAPDGFPLDMDDALHRESLIAGCKRYRELGASELWVDTGGDIGLDFNDGEGVQMAVDLAADHGVRLIPEWTVNLPANCRADLFFRNKRDASNPPRNGPTPDYYRRATYCCVGYNGGGVESPEEVATLAAKGHAMVAWNPDAVEQATLAPDTEIKP